MPSITIKEEDLTNASVLMSDTDVVYIPGCIPAFASGQPIREFEAILDPNDPTTIIGKKDNNAVGLKVFEARLFTSVAEFEAIVKNGNNLNPTLVGQTIESTGDNVIFPNNDDVPNIAGAGLNLYNLAEITEQGVPEGSVYDPSYLLAHDLLSLGIPVVYQRINGFERATHTETTWVKAADAEALPVEDYEAMTDEQKAEYPWYRVDDESTHWTKMDSVTVTVEDPYWIVSQGNLNTIYDVTSNFYLGKALDDSKDNESPESLTSYYPFKSDIADKSAFNIKYLTSGAYPCFASNNGNTMTSPGPDGIRAALQGVVSRRQGDCIALTDPTPNPDRTIYAANNSSIYKAVTDTNFGDEGSYMAMFPFWVKYTSPSTSFSLQIPGSFAYLVALAVSLRNNPNWLAIAGASRGVVPYISGLVCNFHVSAQVADSYQADDNKVAINAIANIPNFGYCIWGNRTLNNNNAGLQAKSFLNIRNVVSDVKKLCYQTAMRYMFEQNGGVLRTKFKSAITPTLDNLLNNQGISGYSFEFIESDKHRLKAKIVINPMYAVEDFEIGIVLSDDDVSIE